MVVTVIMQYIENIHSELTSNKLNKCTLKLHKMLAITIH